MKLAPVLLAASLLANAALVAVLVKQDRTPSSAAPTAATARGAPAATDKSDALRAALASGDAAALEKAGVAPEVARQLALGRAFARFAEKMRALRASDGKWWRNRPPGGANPEQLAALRREFGDILASLTGDDLPGLFGNANDSLAFLSPEKRAALRRITQDYAEMEAKFGAAGLQLPSDRERLKLLRAERDRDIAALLTPAERADYEMRNSPSAATVRMRYGEAIENEEEFRRIFALQKAFDEKFPREAFQGRVSPELIQQRAAADRQLQDDIRNAVGADRYAAMRRATDGDLRNVDSLAQRLNLPADTGDRVAAMRETYAAQTQRINADPALTPQQRRDQIVALGAQARAEVSRMLGGEAGEAYAQSASWLSLMQNGVAYGTASSAPPSGGALTLAGVGQSVYPVPPAGANAGAPGGIRQMVNVVNTSANPGDAGGAIFFAPATPRVIENQVISVTTVDGVTTTRTAPAAVPAPTSPPAHPPAPSPRP